MGYFTAKNVAKYGPGIRGLWKQGWNEIPEIMATAVLAASGIPLAVYGMYRIDRDELDKKRFKYEYIVLRHDDPRVSKISTKES